MESETSTLDGKTNANIISADKPWRKNIVKTTVDESSSSTMTEDGQNTANPVEGIIEGLDGLTSDGWGWKKTRPEPQPASENLLRKSINRKNMKLTEVNWNDVRARIEKYRNDYFE